MTYTPPRFVNYRPDSITFDEAQPWTLTYGDRGDPDWRDQDAAVTDEMRELAAPLTLPGVVHVTYVTGDDGTQAQTYRADLDPAVNRGYVRATFHAYYEEGRGFGITAIRQGDVHAATLGTCPKCGDPWARSTQQSWSDDTDCEAPAGCGYHNAYMIGD